MVSISEGKFTTGLYWKPTDTHQYLDKKSCHLNYVKRAVFDVLYAWQYGMFRKKKREIKSWLVNKYYDRNFFEKERGVFLVRKLLHPRHRRMIWRIGFLWCKTFTLLSLELLKLLKSFIPFFLAAPVHARFSLLCVLLLFVELKIFTIFWFGRDYLNLYSY